MLTNKNILVGITGGIAAYKTIDLIRLLKKANANVRVVLTPAAEAFVTPLTLQAISANPVSNSLLDPHAELAMGHIQLAKWADLVLIAPASADFIARLRAGMANDLLTTLCLATVAPIFIAPAMNQHMFHQKVTQQNLAELVDRAVKVIGPNSGVQACGDVGAGRMSEPNELLQAICDHFQVNQDLQNMVVTVTAGPTREPIDPVRYLSNHSSGKMGFAIAAAFAKRGATVNLIAGPVNLATPINVHRINVQSAVEMAGKTVELAQKSAIFIGCAAVADYRVAEVAQQKIKKNDDNESLTLKLVRNPDIIASVAQLAERRPFTVGFAAETQNVEHYAKQKLVRKKVDLICANNVANGQVFGQDQNALHLFWRTEGRQEHQKILPLANKRDLAVSLVEEIVNLFKITQLRKNDETH
ncbi:bifunctional phosphopantothenoylcysteine decarboxylase/phosphopantothenate--cysteine ligase CoaBC [[Haemophilus] ducreyi]|uniref:bifunctional phosphopantothenoylcysteine decarboxylase/phosphopantothenate--cysteine ligase CoaBC n=1 Tax=Haemophilus ducreyi TaxID=730 RepID=UPI000654D2CA|nr:bifunctional phosphopantothenoylcysteine decarboxylase/phosphopantothenate--cysteine ligase CoaBC [[Haemophilus] ducreyi]AKO45184.1 bifunctional phosphopantothenoylcysteine decarboxylase/phosphopantothenate synthase [[Haemophilus] ducreyi]AKO46586.1 bifunctional phosphopantothenoylcysteine decarboxylase/phosphopantothenate synthase [[Haemophilus] ducreyi]AKO47927.1 bifunctional phosphopantothenoylcysteine decarboxylase/phosphopantothenate synthase [[Haemophilus] ducreyi]AKO49315.1 bifunction